MIRLAKDSETEVIANMWDVCFDDPAHFIKWNFSGNYSPENTLVFEQDGTVMANMQLMPYNMSFCGKVLPVSYVSGVATLPEYRMKGCYKQLQAEAFSLMAERGIPIALLVPFSFEFYEKQGYRNCYDKTTYTAENISFPRGDTEPAALSDNTIARLDKIYSASMQNFNGFIVRSARDWRLILEDIMLNSEGRCLITDGGYALYAENTEKRTAEVFELICENTAAAERLLGGIEGADSIKITAPKSDILSKIAGIRKETKPFAMIRIVDAEAVLKILAGNFRGTVSIKITDENILKNNDVFRISDGAISRGTDADLTIDIKQLAELASGYKTDGYEILNGLFEKRENFVNLLL